MQQNHGTFMEKRFDFDDHVSKSVPEYTEGHEIILAYLIILL